MNGKIKMIVFPVCLVIFYLVYAYFALYYEYNNGLLISLMDVTSANIAVKLTYDFFNSLLTVIVIIALTIFKKSSLGELGITRNNYLIVLLLSIIYLTMFIINGDFSVNGVYQFFFYLVVVSFGEELVFRGYLFNVIDREFKFWIAMIISGILWGVTHAFLGSVISNQSLLYGMLNQLGGGILMGAVFAITMKKSKTIFIPVLIHAILAYSRVFM